ncbi:hypothetical protein N7507_002121 [Penicillium longicatenatum]|nr:hypothetical protein N7507_002121 [Penicillium longicatenatum]
MFNLSLNIQAGKYGTAVQAAALWGYMEVMQILIDQGADINAQGGEYGTALQAAGSRGYTKTTQFLLKHGADVNIKGGKYGTALQATALKGRVETVRLLLDQGADVKHSRRGILLEQGGEIQITEDALKNVLERPNAVQLMNIILPSQENDIKITEKLLISAAQNEQRYHLMDLLLKSNAEILDDHISVREISHVEYSCQEIIQLLLGDKDDSPWNFFEPTYFPCLEINPDRHIAGCCHLTPQAS